MATLSTVNVLTQNVRGFAGSRRGLAAWLTTVKGNVNGSIQDLVALQDTRADAEDLAEPENKYAQSWGFWVEDSIRATPSGLPGPVDLEGPLYSYTLTHSFNM